MDAAEVTTAVASILDTALPTMGMDTRRMRMTPVTPMIQDIHTIPARGLAALGLTTSMATGFLTRTVLQISRITTIRRLRRTSTIRTEVDIARGGHSRL